MADHILLHCKRSTAVIFSLKFSWERSLNISECGECVLDTSRPVSLQAVCRCRHMLWCVRLFSQQASASLTYSCRVTPSSPPILLHPPLLLEAFICSRYPGCVIGHAARVTEATVHTYSWTCWGKYERPKLLFASR